MPEAGLESGLLVQRGQEPRRHYALAHIVFEAEPQPFSVNFIPIALIEGHLLVAAPKLVWSKTVSDRVLPKEPIEEHPGCRLWVGFLQAKWKNRLVLGGAENVDFDVVMEDEVFSEEQTSVQPYGPALAQLADEHFSFLSAQSAGGEGAGGLEDRMARMEETFQVIQGQLQSLVGGGAGSSVVGARPKAAGCRAETRTPGGGAFAGLDPAVVASAREAGVTEGQLREVANLVRKETKLTDLPPRVHGKKNVLSESEDEEEPELLEAVEGGEQETTPAMEKAVLQLTKIVGSLTKKKSSGLEALLDNLEGGDSGGSSSSYQKLRKSLVETPKFLYETIESLMDEDFAHVRAGPGLASVETSSRAWLEHRSKLQNYTNTVRLAWQIASIHDCLRRDARDEARARSALLLTALDQAAIDNTIRCIRSETASRSLGAEHLPNLRRQVGRHTHVEDQGQRCLPGSKEEVGRKQSSSTPSQVRPSFDRSQGRRSEASAKGWKGGEGHQEWKAGCRSSRGDSGLDLRTMQSSPLKVPGAAATSVHGFGIWDVLFDVLSQTFTLLRFGFLSAKRTSARKRADYGQVWPMPLPYPEVRLRLT